MTHGFNWTWNNHKSE